MQENLYTEEEKTEINRNDFLQKIPENYLKFSNEEVLVEVITKGTHTHKNRKRQPEFLEHTMRKKGWENMTLTGTQESKRDRGTHPTNYMTNL